jgi:hypothetical protein
MNTGERNMTMRQMIDKFNEAVENIDSLKFIIDAVKRQPELEKKEWTANDSNVVIGETYYIQSVGVYKIKGTGKGKISWTVKSPKDMKILYQGQMDDTAESDEMILTAGDICYLNASADGGETLVMTLEQTQSLFEMMGTDLVQLQSSVDAMNERLGNALTGVDTKVDEAVETVKDALGYVTPEMFGAVGDGMTDDTEAIQEAIDYCISHDNTPLFFDVKTYCISNTIALPQSHSRPSIRGSERISCIIKWIGTECIPMFEIKGGSGVITQSCIQNLSFNGNSIAECGILAQDVCGLPIRDCSFCNMISCGVLLENYSGFTEFVVAENCDFRGCPSWMKSKHTQGIHYSFHGSGIKSCTGALEENILYIGENCQFYNSPLSAHVWGGTDSSHLVFINANNKYIIQTRRADFYGIIKIESSVSMELFSGTDSTDVITIIGGILSLGVEQSLGKAFVSVYKSTLSDGSSTVHASPCTYNYSGVKNGDTLNDFAGSGNTQYYEIIAMIYSSNYHKMVRFDIARTVLPTTVKMINEQTISVFNVAGISEVSLSLSTTYDGDMKVVLNYDGSDKDTRTFCVDLHVVPKAEFIKRKIEKLH